MPGDEARILDVARRALLRAGTDSVLFARAGFDTRRGVYTLKLVLLRPLPYPAFQEVVRSLEAEGFRVEYVHAPHARALRLDLVRVR